MSKLLFLDVDGVLNSYGWFERRIDILGGGHDRKTHDIDPAAVGLLNQLIDRTDALVVISSTWRMFGHHQCASYLARRGFFGRVLDVTPQMGGPRGAEIQWWLDHCPAHRRPDSFVILDDDSDMVHLSNRLVQTKMETGLTPADVDAAVAMLALPFEWPEGAGPSDDFSLEDVG
jgi:hypothetical protein